MGDQLLKELMVLMYGMDPKQLAEEIVKKTNEEGDTYGSYSKTGSEC